MGNDMWINHKNEIVWYDIVLLLQYCIVDTSCIIFVWDDKILKDAILLSIISYHTVQSCI